MKILNINKNIYTNPVLLSLNKIWQHFSNFRIACYRFPSSELLLNTLVTEMIPLDENVSIETLKQLSNPNIVSDIVAIKKVWEIPFDENSLECCVQIITNKPFTLDQEKKKLFLQGLLLITHSDHDPIIKKFLFVGFMNFVLQNLPEKNRVIRIFGIRFLNHLGFMEYPILYPNKYLELFSSMVEEKQFSMDSLDENTLLFLITQFQNICLLGTFVLTIYHKHIEKNQQLIKKDPYLDKIFINDMFDIIFQNTTLTISDLMNRLNWKRDKTARFLAKLTDIGCFKEIKIGTDKIFINKIILNTFSEIRNNPNIQQLLHNS